MTPQTAQRTRWWRVCAGGGGTLLGAVDAGGGVAGAWDGSVVIIVPSRCQTWSPAPFEDGCYCITKCGPKCILPCKKADIHRRRRSCCATTVDCSSMPDADALALGTRSTREVISSLVILLFFQQALRHPHVAP